MIGRKIYYELDTGDVILITEEKQGLGAVNTTKEQDFQMYSPLQVRSPEAIGMIQLEYGQYSAEFQSARSVKVDTETKEILFEYPRFDPPLITQVDNLKADNQHLRAENEQLKQKANELETALLEMTTISAEQEQAILELSTLLAGGNI